MSKAAGVSFLIVDEEGDSFGDLAIRDLLGYTSEGCDLNGYGSLLDHL